MNEKMFFPYSFKLGHATEFNLEDDFSTRYACSETVDQAQPLVFHSLVEILSKLIKDQKKIVYQLRGNDAEQHIFTILIEFQY